MEGVDFIEEIRIAQFWRKQLGEYEYVYFNPEDLRRWYVALETRGPEDVRSYLIERTGRHPMGQITGIVSTAPHPPLNIINLWLDSYTKVRTRSYWLAAAAFLVFTYYSATNIAGCQAIPITTALQRNPPQIGQPGPAILPPTPPAQSNSKLPAQLPAPAANAAQPTGTSQH